MLNNNKHASLLCHSINDELRKVNMGLSYNWSMTNSAVKKLDFYENSFFLGKVS